MLNLRAHLRFHFRVHIKVCKNMTKKMHFKLQLMIHLTVESRDALSDLYKNVEKSACEVALTGVLEVALEFHQWLRLLMINEQMCAKWLI